MTGSEQVGAILALPREERSAAVLSAVRRRRILDVMAVFFFSFWAGVACALLAVWWF